MKTGIIQVYTKIHLVLAVLVLLGTSCKKDENSESVPEFIGSWVCNQSVDTENGVIDIRDNVTFSKGSFVEIAQIKDEQGYWINLIGRKGNYTVIGDEMNISLTEAGYSGIDNNGNPTGEINYSKKGTSEFSQILVDMEMIQNYMALYKVSGNSLTLVSDTNNNGSFNDDEEFVFTKQ